VAGLQTVLLRSLNGGKGLRFDSLQVTARNGTTTPIDVSGTYTLGEVIERINASKGSMVSASINPAGNGIRFEDLSPGTGDLIVSGTITSGGITLNFGLRASADCLDSPDLKRQYINENTRLDDLNAGRGVARGKFKIIAGNGASATIDLTQGNETTLADVIQEINGWHIGVEASINGAGDGLLLTDTTNGTGLFSVAEDGGTTAADLGILRTAASGETIIDGSFKRVIEIDSDDALNDVMGRINAAKIGVQASVINDGSQRNPYRLVLTSQLGGRRGEMLVDPGDTGLSLSTLTEAHDAVVFVGRPGSGQNLLLSSSSNTLDKAVPGVNIDLLATSPNPVEVNVSSDVDSIVTDIQTFVTAFNSVVDKMDKLTSFNSETYEKGILFGDATLEQVRSRLYQMMRQTVSGAGLYRRFSDVGLSLGSGAKLQFDEDRFRRAMASNRQDVETLFTQAKQGLGVVVDRELNNLSASYTGLIDRHDESLQNQEDLLNKRIADMQVVLDSKQQRMLQQFYAMEQALAQLQSQQSALTGLSALVTQMYSTSTSSKSG
jgi:flagellar hook-associated protein 2